MERFAWCAETRANKLRKQLVIRIREQAKFNLIMLPGDAITLNEVPEGKLQRVHSPSICSLVKLRKPPVSFLSLDFRSPTDEERTEKQKDQLVFYPAEGKLSIRKFTISYNVMQRTCKVAVRKWKKGRTEAYNRRFDQHRELRSLLIYFTMIVNSIGSVLAFLAFQRVSHRAIGSAKETRQPEKEIKEKQEKRKSRFEKRACPLATSPKDISSRVYLRGAGVINHGFVCLPERRWKWYRLPLTRFNQLRTVSLVRATPSPANAGLMVFR